MNHVFSTSTGVNSTQSPFPSGFSSFNNFVSTMCATATPPTLWFSAYYTPQANFCTVNPC